MSNKIRYKERGKTINTSMNCLVSCKTDEMFVTVYIPAANVIHTVRVFSDIDKEGSNGETSVNILSFFFFYDIPHTFRYND